MSIFLCENMNNGSVQLQIFHFFSHYISQFSGKSVKTFKIDTLRWANNLLIISSMDMNTVEDVYGFRVVYYLILRKPASFYCKLKIISRTLFKHERVKLKVDKSQNICVN